jgi:hypothetical protein
MRKVLKGFAALASFVGILSILVVTGTIQYLVLAIVFAFLAFCVIAISWGIGDSIENWNKPRRYYR